MTDHIPYMIFAAIPAFCVGWITGAVHVRRAFTRYLRRRYTRGGAA